MRGGELCPLSDWCAVTRGAEEIQHFVTPAADRGAEPGLPIAGWQPGTPALPGKCAARFSRALCITKQHLWFIFLFGCGFFFLSAAVPVLLGWETWVTQREAVGLDGCPSPTRALSFGRAELPVSPTWGRCQLLMVHKPCFPLQHPLQLFSLWCSWERLVFSFCASEKCVQRGVTHPCLAWLWMPQFPLLSSQSEDMEDQAHKYILG